MSVKNLAVVFVAVAATFVAASCQRDQVTGLDSAQKKAPSGPRRDLVDQSFVIPIPPNNSESNGDGALGWTHTGIVLPAHSGFIATVSGTVQVSEASVPCDHPTVVTQEYGPNGLSNSDHELAVGFTITDPDHSPIVMSPIGSGPSGPTTIRSDTVYTGAGGEILVRRNGIAGGTNCGQIGASYGFYALSAPSQTISIHITWIMPPSVVVTCSPGTLVRVDSVTCVTTVPGATSFTVLEKRAEIQKRAQLGTYVVLDSTADSVWAGLAIDNTSVKVTVSVNANGIQQTTSGTGSFTVTPRTWTRFNFPTARPPLIDVDTLHLNGPAPGIIVAALGSGLRDSFPDGGLGVNVSDYREDSNGIVSQGPNKNMYYRITQPFFYPESVFIRTSLLPSNPFYTRQLSTKKLKGEPNPTPYSRYCDGKDLDTLRKQARWHEGTDSNWVTDHHKAQVTFYQSTDVMRFMEAAWVPFTDPIDTRLPTPRIRTVDSLEWRKTLVAQQKLIDSKVPNQSPAPIAAPVCKLRP